MEGGSGQGRDDLHQQRVTVLAGISMSASTTFGCSRPGHAFEIRGRIRHDGLLAVNQEAACGTLVAGAGSEPEIFGL